MEKEIKNYMQLNNANVTENRPFTHISNISVLNATTNTKTLNEPNQEVGSTKLKTSDLKIASISMDNNSNFFHITNSSIREQLNTTTHDHKIQPSRDVSKHVDTYT
jgi:hypothetical protein